MRVNQIKDRVDSLLSLGLRELSMTLAVLARIDQDNYEIFAVQSNSGAYVPGEKYRLGKSLSREVFDKQQTIAETGIDNSSNLLLHPLYRSRPLECYLGAPIRVHGEPWGCLDFSSMAQRDTPFGEQELKLIDSLASEISQLLGEVS
jgi:transcriptional regulator with GAF, ATPase, and Fis domain